MDDCLEVLMKIENSDNLGSDWSKVKQFSQTEFTYIHKQFTKYVETYLEFIDLINQN